MRGIRIGRVAVLSLSLALLGACSTAPPLATSTLVAPASVAMMLRGNLSGQTLLATGVAYLAYDPLAPNWEIVEQPSGEGRYVMLLRQRSINSGGDGEARQVLARRANVLMRDGGYSSYQLLRLEEGVESTRPFAQRVAEAEIRLLRSTTWPEF